MTRVLVLSVTRAPTLALQEALARFDELGAEVHLAFVRNPGTVVTDQPHAASKIIKPRRGVGDGPAPARHSLAWFRVVGRNVVISAVLARLPVANRSWYMARWDHDVRTWARDADILVALDRYAVYPVWRLARTHRRAVALFGLDAALREVGRRAEADRRSQDASAVAG